MHLGEREKFYQITKRSSNLGEGECKIIFIYAEKDKMSAFDDALVMLKNHLIGHKHIYEYDDKTIDELIKTNISSNENALAHTYYYRDIYGGRREIKFYLMELYLIKNFYNTK